MTDAELTRLVQADFARQAAKAAEGSEFKICKPKPLTAKGKERLARDIDAHTKSLNARNMRNA